MFPFLRGGEPGQRGSHRLERPEPAFRAPGLVSREAQHRWYEEAQSLQRAVLCAAERCAPRRRLYARSTFDRGEAMRGRRSLGVGATDLASHDGAPGKPQRVLTDLGALQRPAEV